MARLSVTAAATSGLAGVLTEGKYWTKGKGPNRVRSAAGLRVEVRPLGVWSKDIISGQAEGSSEWRPMKHPPGHDL